MELKGKVMEAPLSAESKLLVVLGFRKQPVQLRGRSRVQLKALTTSNDVLLHANCRTHINLLGSVREYIPLKGKKTKALRGNTLVSNTDVWVSDVHTKVSFQ